MEDLGAQAESNIRQAVKNDEALSNQLCKHGGGLVKYKSLPPQDTVDGEREEAEEDTPRSRRQQEVPRSLAEMTRNWTWRQWLMGEERDGKGATLCADIDKEKEKSLLRDGAFVATCVCPFGEEPPWYLNFGSAKAFPASVTLAKMEYSQVNACNQHTVKGRTACENAAPNCTWLPYVEYLSTTGQVTTRSPSESYGVCSAKNIDLKVQGMSIPFLYSYSWVLIIVCMGLRFLFLKRGTKALFKLVVVIGCVTLFGEIVLKKVIPWPAFIMRDRPDESCVGSLGFPSSHSVLTAALLVYVVLEVYFHNSYFTQYNNHATTTRRSGRKSTNHAARESSEIIGTIKDYGTAENEDHESRNSIDHESRNSIMSAESDDYLPGKCPGETAKDCLCRALIMPVPWFLQSLLRLCWLGNKSYLTGGEKLIYVNLHVLLLLPVGVSRIWIRDHSPFQVLAGLVIGVYLGIIAYTVDVYLRRRFHRHLGKKFLFIEHDMALPYSKFAMEVERSRARRKGKSFSEGKRKDIIAQLEWYKGEHHKALSMLSPKQESGGERRSLDEKPQVDALREELSHMNMLIETLGGDTKPKLGSLAPQFPSGIDVLESGQLSGMYHQEQSYDTEESASLVAGGKSRIQGRM